MIPLVCGRPLGLLGCSVSGSVVRACAAGLWLVLVVGGGGGYGGGARAAGGGGGYGGGVRAVAITPLLG